MFLLSLEMYPNNRGHLFFSFLIPNYTAVIVAFVRPVYRDTVCLVLPFGEIKWEFEPPTERSSFNHLIQ